MTPIFYAAAFLSGCAALVFEMLFFRLAGTLIGRSVWTTAIVTGAFMAGLALGNAFSLRLRKVSSSPQKIFAILECVAAFSGAAVVFVFPHMTRVLAGAFHAVSAAPVVLNLLRCGVAFALMGLPAAAMGASFPLLVSAVVRRGSSYGPALGAAYGWNTAGAVAGVLGCELIFIRAHGIAGSGVLAALLNVLAGLIVFFVSSAARPAAKTPVSSAPLRAALCPTGKTSAPLRAALCPTGKTSAPLRAALCPTGKTSAPLRAALCPTGKTSAPSRAARTRVLCGIFFAGFCLLALETIWFRFLSLFFVQISLSFSVMLAVVLAGSACGGMAASIALRRSPGAVRHAGLLAWLNGALIFAGYLCLPFFLMRPQFFLPGSLDGLLAGSALLMFSPAFVSGALFVLTGGMLRQRVQDETGAAAGLVFFNTVGGAAGSLCAALVLIPAAGIELSFAVVMCLYGVIAACVGREPDVSRSKNGRRVYYAAAGIWLGAVAAFPFGLMRDFYSVLPVRPFLREGMRRVALKEGVNETVQYMRADFLGKPRSFQLVTNSHPMASTSFLGRRYMEYLAFWPLAVHRNPKKVLVISYGTGKTAGVFAAVKGVERLDVVDVSADVLALSGIVNADNDPLRDPRVRTHIDDGRFFLAASGESYDIITGEPPPPKTQGVVNLYTAEFFRLMKERLAPGGIATYWLPISQLNPGEAKSITAAFCGNFDYCAIWAALPFEWMLVGTRGEVQRMPTSRFSWLWKNPELGAELRRIGFESPGQFGTFFVADGPRLTAWHASSPPLTDNFPQRLTDDVPDGEYLDKDYYELLDPRGSSKNFRESVFISTLWPFMETAQSVSSFRFRDDAYKILGGYEGLSSMDRVRSCLEEKSLEPYLALALGSDPDFQAIIAEHLAGGETVRIQDAGEHLAAWVARRGEYARAAEYYGWLARNRPVYDDIWDAFRIYFLYLAGGTDRSAAQAAGEEYINGAPKEEQDGRRRRVEDLWRWIEKSAVAGHQQDREKKRMLLESLTRQYERVQSEAQREAR